MHFTIFYAWQLDRPEKCNKYFIRDAAETAIKTIRADADIDLAPSLDHDTKGVPGIPDIPATICEKIDRCGIFLADMTFSGETSLSDQKKKFLPNPNVLIELGYALARVGPGRIIYVMNTAFGPAVELPFDIRSRRHPIAYELADHKATNFSEIQKDLSKKIQEAIRTVIDSGVLSSSEDVATKLSDFIVDGQQLTARSNERPLPIQDHNDWVARAESYLDDTLGVSYKVRFSDFTGITFYGDGSERSQFLNSIKGRTQRLHEFIREVNQHGGR